jgi:hypothetical protein
LTKGFVVKVANAFEHVGLGFVASICWLVKETEQAFKTGKRVERKLMGSATPQDSWNDKNLDFTWYQSIEAMS